MARCEPKRGAHNTVGAAICTASARPARAVLKVRAPRDPDGVAAGLSSSLRKSATRRCSTATDSSPVAFGSGGLPGIPCAGDIVAHDSPGARGSIEPEVRLP